MNDRQLDRNLQSIGKECFVSYFKEFSDFTRSNESIAEQIREERGYTWKACLSRTSHARNIIKSERAEDALIVCSESPRLSAHIRERSDGLAARFRST